MKRMTRRRILHIGIVLLVLVALLLAAVQVVLWTDWPRRIALAQLQKQLGLKIDAKSMSLGWTGRTTLQNVQVSLPLATQALLTVPTLKVKITAPPLLLLGVSLQVQSIQIDQPVLTVVQDAQGRWNLQQLAQLLGNLGGVKSSQPAASSTPHLPDITIHQATIDILDNQARALRIAPVDLAGNSSGPLVYRYHLQAQEQLLLDGQVATGGNWNHQLHLEASQLAAWFKPWVKQFPADAKLVANWQGQLAGGKVQGQLTIAQAQAAGISGDGVIKMATEDQALILRPQLLQVRTGSAQLARIGFTGGQITLEAGQVRVERLLASAFGGQISFNGRYNPQPVEASLTMAWDQLLLPGAVRHSGSLDLSMQYPWPDQLRLGATLTNRSALAGGQLKVQAAATAAGKSFNDLQGQLEISQLHWAGRKTFAAPKVVGRFSNHEGKFAVNDVRTPDAGRLDGRGGYRVQTGEWFVYLDGDGWTLPGGSSASGLLNCWGDWQKITLSQMYFQAGQLQVEASGKYVYADPQPVYLSVAATHPPLGETEAITDIPLGGTLRSRNELRGTAYPLNLNMEGMLYGQQLVFRNRPLGDVLLAVHGNVDDQHVELRTERAKLLGGQWEFHAHYPTADSALRVEVNVEDLPLADAGDLLKFPRVQGTLNADWKMDIPALSLNQIGGTGSFEMRNVRAWHLEADRVGGRWELSSGELVCPDLRFTHQKGAIDGKISLDLHHPKDIHVELRPEAWPIQKGSARLLLWGESKLEVSGANVAGPIHLHGQLFHKEKPLGQIDTDMDLAWNHDHQGPDRRLLLHKLAATALNGTISGQGVFRLDNPLQSTLTLSARDIEAKPAGEIWPVLKDLTGKFSLQVDVAPSADQRRALEPLKITATLTSKQAAWRQVQIGDGLLVAYTDAHRIVLGTAEAQQAQLSIAGGSLTLWGRAGKQPDGTFLSQAIVEMHSLDLQQIINSGEASARTMPGLIDGQITLVGNPANLDQLFGDATVKISQSDLVNFAPINALYSLFSALGDKGQSLGNGELALRLESSKLNLTHMRYFNRGVEIRGMATVDHVWQIPDSPVSGTFVGSARPLRDLKLPLVADADAIFNSLQSSTTSVRLHGTLRDPKAAVVPFADIGNDMRSFLLGDMKK